MTSVNTAESPGAKKRRAAAVTSCQSKSALSTKVAPSKADILAKLLARPKGATVAEVSIATGWQPHSVRAFFSGLRKKGAALEREARKDGTWGYRLMPTAQPTTSAVNDTTLASDECTAAVTGGDV